MRVIVKRVPGAEISATHLYVRGGARNWGKDDAGIEALLMRAMASGGTRSRDKSAFASRLAEIGSQLRAVATNDYAFVEASSLTPRWDDTFELLVDAFRRPALPPSEIELTRQRLLAQLRSEQENPDARLNLLVHETIFRDHPYGNRAVGRLDTVAKIDAAAVARHHQKLQETTRLVLIVVGDVDAAHVVDAARKAFADLPRGAFVDAPLPAWKVDKPAMFVTEQKLPTNYITAVFAAPTWRDPDYPVAQVAMYQLHRRVWEAVRTKRGLSYAARAWYAGSAMPLGVLYVTAVDPKATWPVMLGEARRFRTEPPPQKEVDGSKATMLTAYYVDHQSSAGQARALAEAELLGGDWRLERTFKDRVAAVTAADVHAFATKRIDKLQTFVLGNPTLVDEALLLAPL
jgi:zinc protease